MATVPGARVIRIERQNPITPLDQNSEWEVIARLPGDATEWTDIGVTHVGKVRYRLSSSDEAQLEWSAGELLEVLLPPVELPYYDWDIREDASLSVPTIAALAFGNGRYVAVGQSGGKGSIETSLDGLSWSPAAISGPRPGKLMTVIHDGTRFIAAGERGSVGTSSDGLTWVFHAASNPDDFPFGVDYLASNGSTVVADAVGGSSLFVRGDLTTWRNVSTLGHGLVNVLYFDGKFVALTGHSSGGVSHRSMGSLGL